ncbi:hypothetical protein OSTOST_00452 [Ostertagia ostertagi]
MNKEKIGSLNNDLINFSVSAAFPVALFGAPFGLPAPSVNTVNVGIVSGTGVAAPPLFPYLMAMPCPGHTEKSQLYSSALERSSSQLRSSCNSKSNTVHPPPEALNTEYEITDGKRAYQPLHGADLT